LQGKRPDPRRRSCTEYCRILRSISVRKGRNPGFSAFSIWGRGASTRRVSRSGRAARRQRGQ
jgi:hypothetical protein